jgi:hypothetical protein
MSHAVIGRVHGEAFQPADLADDGVDALIAGGFALTFRDIGPGDTRPVMAQAQADARPEADAPTPMLPTLP